MYRKEKDHHEERLKWLEKEHMIIEDKLLDHSIQIHKIERHQKPIPTKEDYKDHIVNKYTATRRATTCSYVSSDEEATIEEERLKANTIHEIIKRLNRQETK